MTYGVTIQTLDRAEGNGITMVLVEASDAFAAEVTGPPHRRGPLRLHRARRSRRPLGRDRRLTHASPISASVTRRRRAFRRSRGSPRRWPGTPTPAAVPRPTVAARVPLLPGRQRWSS